MTMLKFQKKKAVSLCHMGKGCMGKDIGRWPNKLLVNFLLEDSRVLSNCYSPLALQLWPSGDDIMTDSLSLTV